MICNIRRLSTWEHLASLTALDWELPLWAEDDEQLAAMARAAQQERRGGTMEDCRAEVMGLHEYVKENFGYEMSLFRFPMGEFSEADLSLLQQLGYRSVFWSFAYRDWLVDEQPDPQQAIETIESKCHPGAIYLLHAVSQTNAQVLGQVIDDLRAQGYTFCAYGE